MVQISEEYSRFFLDDERYAGRPQHQLEGLTPVIEDTDPEWRPTLSEFIKLIPPRPDSNKLLISGTAYGSEKLIQDEFPESDVRIQKITLIKENYGQK